MLQEKLKNTLRVVRLELFIGMERDRERGREVNDFIVTFVPLTVLLYGVMVEVTEMTPNILKEHQWDVD